MKRLFLCLCFLILSGNAFGQAQASKVKLPDTIFIASLNSNYTFANDTNIARLIPIPIVFYQKQNVFQKDARLTFITGGIFNSVLYDSDSKEGWAWQAQAISFFLFSGDFVNIDGNRFQDQYDFNGNDYQLLFGINYKKRILNLPFKLSLQWLNRYRQFYAFTNSANFIGPDSFFSFGPQFKMEYGFYVADIPTPRLFKVTFVAEYLKRIGAQNWGVPSQLNTSQNFLTLELKSKSKFTFKEDWSLWTDLNGALIVNADRLNALQRGTTLIADEFDQLFFSQVRASKAFKFRSVIKRRLLKNEALNFGIGAVTSIYQELLPTGTRTQWAYGGQTGLSGRAFQKRFYWHLDYGIISGVNSTKPLQEVAFKVSWRFRP